MWRRLCDALAPAICPVWRPPPSKLLLENYLSYAVGTLVGLSLEASHISLPTVPGQAWELKFCGEGYEIGNETSMLIEWQLC